MANSTTKPASDMSEENVLRGAYNDVDKTLSTSSFITAKLGHKISQAIINPTTSDWSWYDVAVLLYTIRIIYTDASHTDIVSVERTV